MTDEQKNLVMAGTFIGLCVTMLAAFCAFAYFGHRQTGQMQQKLTDSVRRPADDEV